MRILSFEEFIIKLGIYNKAMSNIRLEGVGKDINLTPIEIVMRDETPKTIYENNSNIIVILMVHIGF